ncbi:hypothetical protein [Streptomyces sp. NPDC055085]
MPVLLAGSYRVIDDGQGLSLIVDGGPEAGAHALVRAADGARLGAQDVVWKPGTDKQGGRLVFRGTDTAVDGTSEDDEGSGESVGQAPERKGAAPAGVGPSPYPGPRNGAVYVLCHGAKISPEVTFVPDGVTVQFYAEEGEPMEEQTAALRLMGVEVPIPKVTPSRKKINNYGLGPFRKSELIGYAPLIQRLATEEVLFLGTQSSLPGVDRLCTEPEECAACFATTEIARHLDKCSGLFGPMNAMYLATVTHLLTCRATPSADSRRERSKSKAAIIGIVDRVIRRREGLASAEPIPRAAEARFWETLTIEDIDALDDPVERTAVLNFISPATEQYFQRERSAPTGYGADPATMEKAVQQLQRTADSLAAEAKANVDVDLAAAQAKALAAAQAEAAQLEQPPLDRAQEDAITLQAAAAFRAINTVLAKAVAHIDATTTQVLPMIDAHRLASAAERKAPLSMPSASAASLPAAPAAPPAASGPAPDRGEAKSASGNDPLTGISLLRHQLWGELTPLSQHLDQEYPPSQHPAVRTTPAYLRWLSLLDATDAFLRDVAIARPIARDTVNEHATGSREER